MLCRYATHLFEQSSLPQTAEEAGAQVVHTNSDGGGPNGLASPGLSRHDSKLTAMMDDQPDEDYWWDVMHMQFAFLRPPPRPEIRSCQRASWVYPEHRAAIVVKD